MSALTVTLESDIVDKLNIASNKYTVRLARNRSEVEAALALRFKVFNLELNEGLEESYKRGLDEDKYDKQFAHLLVLDNTTEQVVGTYRMQTSEMAEKGEGFYTNEEFDLSAFPDEILHNAVELGRACIHKDHRNGRVLYLLWRGLAKFMELSGKRYLFGCCSITSQDSEIGAIARNHLEKHGYVHPEYYASVRKEFVCCVDATSITDKDEIELPKLFRLYLDIGAKICSNPAMDRTFKTIDFLILLDVKQLSEHSRTLFFK